MHEKEATINNYNFILYYIIIFHIEYECINDISLGLNCQFMLVFIAVFYYVYRPELNLTSFISS